MIQALVITLREGVEAALVIGIAIAFLQRASRHSLVHWVYWALGVAVTASLALGYAFARWSWNQERFEGWVMLGASTLVASLVYTMWRAGQAMKAQLESGLRNALGSPAAGPALFAFVFVMVLREGVETVLLLAAIGLNSEDLWSAGATVLGLALSVVFGVMFIRGSVRVDLARFFRMTTVILCFVAFQLAVSGIHELSEQGVVPTTREIMSTVGPIVTNQVFFFVLILTLAAIMVLMDWRSRGSAAAVAAGERLGSAERRLAEWTARRERLWMSAVCAASAVFVVMVTAEFIYAKNQAVLSPAKTVAAQDGWVTIPVTEIADGDLHRYLAETPQGPVRFFLIKRSGQDPGVVLDACEICGPLGYYKQGPNLICRNCGAAIYIPSVGAEGGCNPIPLEHNISSGQVRVSSAALEKAAHHFAAGGHSGHGR